jgi:Siphovirus-type tail component, C-terminal domain
VANAQAGVPFTLNLSFFNEENGLLADPSSIQLDVTYGGVVGQAPDVPGGGPFTYAGASSAAANTIWRTGVGEYSCLWAVPLTAPQGVYTANWTCGYQGDDFLGTENFVVQGGVQLSFPAGDLGYWSGSLAYTPAAGTPAQPVTVTFGAVDGSGVGWLWQKVEGWDSPDVQGSGVIPRSGDHGAWASPQYYAARTMTLTVMASAPSQALRDQARATLQAAVPVSDLALLTYGEPVPKQAWVRRSGKVSETYPTLADVVFSIGLVAPDPRKYGTAQKSVTKALAPPNPGGGLVVPFTLPVTLQAAPPPADVVATNAGNFETPLVAVITGPVTAPVLANLTTGQAVSWASAALATGEQLVVDFLNRQAWLSPSVVSLTPGVPSTGGTYYAADVPSSWWQLAPGANTLYYSGTSGNGSSATFYYRDSFI